jgi:hypothetical protein
MCLARSLFPQSGMVNHVNTWRTLCPETRGLTGFQLAGCRWQAHAA